MVLGWGRGEILRILFHEIRACVRVLFFLSFSVYLCIQFYKVYICMYVFFLSSFECCAHNCCRSRRRYCLFLAAIVTGTHLWAGRERVHFLLFSSPRVLCLKERGKKTDGGCLGWVGSQRVVWHAPRSPAVLCTDKQFKGLCVHVDLDKWYICLCLCMCGPEHDNNTGAWCCCDVVHFVCVCVSASAVAAASVKRLSGCLSFPTNKLLSCYDDGTGTLPTRRTAN